MPSQALEQHGQLQALGAAFELELGRVPCVLWRRADGDRAREGSDEGSLAATAREHPRKACDRSAGGFALRFQTKREQALEHDDGDVA